MEVVSEVLMVAMASTASKSAEALKGVEVSNEAKVLTFSLLPVDAFLPTFSLEGQIITKRL